MKKLCLLLTMLLLCCGCSNKNNELPGEVTGLTEEDLTVAEAGETAPEQKRLVLKSSNFKDVHVDIVINNGKPPEEVNYIDIGDLDFGSKVPPCAEGSVARPNKGKILESVVGDGEVYFMVNYDTQCKVGTHSGAFFKYNTEKDELTEILSLESLDDKVSVIPWSMKYFKGKLYYIGTAGKGKNSWHYVVYSLDVETGERRVSFADIAVTNKEAPNYPIDELVCRDGHLYALDYTDGAGRSKSSQSIYELDPETGEWEEIFFEIDPYRPAMIFDGKLVTINRNQNKKVCIHTEKYDFLSPYRSASLVYAGDDEIALMQSNRLAEEWIGIGGPYASSELQVYNIEKKEHYTFFLNELGAGVEVEKVKNGYLITDSDMSGTPVYYLLPQLGMAFNVIDKHSENYEYLDREEIETENFERYEQGYSVINVNTTGATVSDNNKIVYVEK